MDYQVWTKEEYGDLWTRVDCGDLGAAKRELDKAVRGGGQPLLTVEVAYEMGIKIGEVISEAKKGGSNGDKGARAKSESKVRSGDMGAVPELNKGSGDPGAGDSVPGE